MKPIPILIASALVATAAGAGTSLFLSDDGRGRVDAGGPEETEGSLQVALDRLEGTLERIAARQDELDRELAAETLATPNAPAPSVEVSPEDIERAVARWLEANGSPELAGPAPEADDDPMAAMDTSELLELLIANGSGDQRLWQSVRDAGRMDEVLAAFEETCEMDPNNPDLRVELAGAYIQKIFEVGSGPLAGVYGQKADEAFARALELDETHWDARFGKAIALSNWPAFLGKTGEAIHHLEVLTEQQQGQPKEARFGDTYLFLGNMYQRTGETEKALEAWRKGLALFPGRDDLAEQIRLNEG